MKKNKFLLIITTTFLLLTTVYSSALPGAKESLTVQGAEVGTQAEQIDLTESPLRPPDTSSPRATLYGFLEDVNEAWELFTERENITDKMSRQPAFNRAVRYFDLSTIPESRENQKALNVAVLMLDVLNRIALPEPQQIPDATEVKQSDMNRWSIPNTAITITKVQEGPREGEWLFTSDVVQNIKQYYDQIQHLPVKSDAIVENAYQVTLTLSGDLFNWVNFLPSWAHEIYFEQTLWQWFLLIIHLLILASMAFFWIHWLFPVASKNYHSTYSRLLRPITIMILSYIMLYMIDDQINISGTLKTILDTLFNTTFYVAMSWAAVLLSHVVAELIISSPLIHSNSSRAQLIRMGFTVVGIVIIMAISVDWGLSLGIPILGVFTGLGVGGIAVALAAQRTVENYIGSLTLIADPPVRIGDMCSFGDIKKATVIDIGWRSTRVRTRERTVVTIPNAEFSRMLIENLGKRDQILLQTVVSLRLNTSTEQLESILSKIRELLFNHESVDNEPARVRLINIGPRSLDIEIFAYVKTTVNNEFLKVKEEINLQILQEVEKAGTTLAPPAVIHYSE